MQVSIETTSGLERRLTIEVPANRIDSAVNARLQKEAKTIEMNGFRRGKAPFKLVKQRYGRYVRQQVTGEVVSHSFYEAVSQQKLRPAGLPSFEPVRDEEGENLEYVATFEVYPEVAIGDLSAIEVSRPVAEITEADVDKMISVLREQQARWRDVERAAAEGDRVTVDFVGTKNGAEFEGGKGENHNLIIGASNPVPGFGEAVLGMSAGDEKQVLLTFQEDCQVAELKGAAVEFSIKVTNVAERQPAELDDEFFASYGVTEGGEEGFRKEVTSNMERELKNAVNSKLKARVVKQLIDLHDIELPKSLIGSEIEALKRQILQQYAGDAGRNIDLSALPDDLFRAQAERRVSLGLIFAAVIKANDIKVDGDQVRDRINEIASTYEQPGLVVEYYYADPKMLDGVRSAVLEQQVVEHILDGARVTEEAISYEEALKPDERPAAESEDE